MYMLLMLLLQLLLAADTGQPYLRRPQGGPPDAATAALARVLLVSVVLGQLFPALLDHQPGEVSSSTLSEPSTAPGVVERGEGPAGVENPYGVPPSSPSAFAAVRHVVVLRREEGSLSDSHDEGSVNAVRPCLPR